MAAACQLQFLELLASLPTSPELRMLTIVTMADLGSQLSELSIFSQFVSLSLFYFLFVSWWYLSVGYSKGLLVNFSCHCRCIFLFVGQVMFSHLSLVSDHISPSSQDRHISIWSCLRTMSWTVETITPVIKY